MVAESVTSQQKQVKTTWQSISRDTNVEVSALSPSQGWFTMKHIVLVTKVIGRHLRKIQFLGKSLASCLWFCPKPSMLHSVKRNSDCTPVNRLQRTKEYPLSTFTVIGWIC